MAGKAKREAERQAQPAAVVDLNLWDMLFRLMELKDGPEVPERDQEPGDAVPGHTREVAGTAKAKAARRNAGQRSRRKTRRVGEPSDPGP